MYNSEISKLHPHFLGSKQFKHNSQETCCLEWNNSITIKPSQFTKARWTNLGIIDRNYCIIKVTDIENEQGTKVTHILSITKRENLPVWKIIMKIYEYTENIRIFVLRTCIFQFLWLLPPLALGRNNNYIIIDGSTFRSIFLLKLFVALFKYKLFRLYVHIFA